MTAPTAVIKVLCSNGLREAMHELGPPFERASGCKIDIRFGQASAFKKMIEDGAEFDMAVLTPPLIDDLIRQGKIAASTRTLIARTGMGLLTRKGGPKPDISSGHAFTRTLVGAKTIAYPSEGASGVLFLALLDRLKLAETLKAKLRPVRNAVAVEAIVENGEVEFGVLPISEILSAHGIELVAAFPREAQDYVVMTAGLNPNGKAAAPARDLIKHLTASTAHSILKSKGMEPG